MISHSVQGDRLGFPFKWIKNVMAKACAMVMPVMIFVEKLRYPIMSVWVLLVWNVKVCAIPEIVLITFINCLSTIAGARKSARETHF